MYILVYLPVVALVAGTVVVVVVVGVPVPVVVVVVACSDLAGYFEEGTGHTCETYIDYGFCNGTSVVATSGIDSAAAQQNCCACGKGSG
ncbi:unnamed protein product [Rotaria socialis]|uniref:Uncharacterized protein n=1 Tax=Rotaria socialis TaxID=392032 RepID=A0A817XT27_9BILA|nr:unnamed protein product [Rotaria socialis]